MSETKHTPLPWKVSNETGYIGQVVPYPPDSVAYIPILSPWREDAWDGSSIAHANAQLIVNSVNARPKVEELLALALDFADDHTDDYNAAVLRSKAREVEAALKI